VAKIFVCDIICGEHIPDKHKPFTLTCSKYWGGSYAKDICGR
jgi:hypothetical protein